MDLQNYCDKIMNISKDNIPLKENSKDRLPLVINDPFFTSSHGGDKKSKNSSILSLKQSVSNYLKGCVRDIS